MKKRQRKDAQETRQRLLAAAAEVFADKGFWETTHAEICQKARANTAAVNYHFGSKENLYVEAWKYAWERSLEAHPPDGGIAPTAPVRERLHGRILAFMQRIADPDNHEIEIMHKEMANPTGLLSEALPQAIEPMRQGMRSIVRELLGERASEPQVALCVMSLIGQCFGPMLHLRRAKLPPGTPRPAGLPLPFGVAELAEHVTRFSLTGIQGIRQGMPKGRESGPRAAAPRERFQRAVTSGREAAGRRRSRIAPRGLETSAA
jgi:AcrR family transcriptional regulator